VLDEDDREKSTILMMVDDINKNGGLLGKKIEAVVVDPASNWPLFAKKARVTSSTPATPAKWMQSGRG
jgi:ABC-type branched-subunit amino acid transport system substrate-binding protein